MSMRRYPIGILTHMGPPLARQDKFSYEVAYKYPVTEC